MVPRVVGSIPTRHPKLGYSITVNMSDSDSDDCGSNPCVPTIIREVAKVVKAPVMQKKCNLF